LYKTKEKNEEKRFNDLKIRLNEKFKAINTNEKFYFEDITNLNVPIDVYDTTISTFIYRDNFSFNRMNPVYLQCAYEAASVKANNKRADDLLEKDIKELSKEYGNYPYSLLTIIPRDKFFSTVTNSNCSQYFDDIKLKKRKQNSIVDYKRFMNEYVINYCYIELLDSINLIDANSEINRLKTQFSASQISKADLNIKSLISVKKEYLSFSSEVFGKVKYSLDVTYLDYERLNRRLESLYREFYGDNSLYNGAMPYGYCYGTRNSGRSAVKIKAGNSDVLISIKNMYGKVIRHAYVKANHSFSLNIENGSYSVHFYYGRGWNPKAFIKKTNCGNLIGGFVSNVQVDKDPNILYLHNQVMEYTLFTQTNGNFQTEGSSLEEAF